MSSVFAKFSGLDPQKDDLFKPVYLANGGDAKYYDLAKTFQSFITDPKKFYVKSPLGEAIKDEIADRNARGIKNSDRFTINEFSDAINKNSLTRAVKELEQTTGATISEVDAGKIDQVAQKITEMKVADKVLAKDRALVNTWQLKAFLQTGPLILFLYGKAMDCP